MGTRDSRIDAYIAKSADFAKPILAQIRSVVHSASPEIVETIKWGMPSFEYKGLLCGMAAFKQHAVLGFWKGSLIVDAKHNKSVDGMGNFGRITSLKDLPPKTVLAKYVKKAMQLNENGVKAPHMVNRRKLKPLPAPADLTAALRNNAKARATFQAFSPSAKREYIEWITGARAAATRATRLATAVEWMAEGKQRNWKYMKKG